MISQGHRRVRYPYYRQMIAPEKVRSDSPSGHSSYDCEYVALAQHLGLTMVSGDRRLVQKFPETAVLLEEFAGK